MDFQQILVVAASEAGGAAASLYGPETVVNGGFDTDSDWSGVLWSISGGTANAATGGVARSFVNNSGTGADGVSTYHCVFTITSLTTGSVAVQAGGISGTFQTAPGTYTEDIVATGTNVPAIRASANTIASCDNVSIRKVL